MEANLTTFTYVIKTVIFASPHCMQKFMTHFLGDFLHVSFRAWHVGQVIEGISLDFCLMSQPQILNQLEQLNLIQLNQHFPT